MGPYGSEKFQNATPTTNRSQKFLIFPWIFLTMVLTKKLGHMSLLNINRKAYMGSQMTLSHLALSDLERSIARSQISKA